MKTVIIAEDEEALRTILTEVVGGLGHRVVDAVDGDDALTLARAQPPDLVITDEKMPRRTGSELARAMRDEPRLAGVPVILLSAARPRTGPEVWRFLTKPLRLAELERAVTEAIGAPAPPAAPPAPPAPQPRAVDLDETIHWLAHELRSPLSSAHLMAQLLLRRMAPEAERERRAVEVILRQLGRVSDFMGDVLDAARLQEGRLTIEPRPLDLAAWLADEADEWRRAHEGLAVTLAAPPEPLVVQADPPRLRQVLSNLVASAVERGPRPVRVDVGVEPAPGLVRVHVTDHGPELSADELPQVLERLHRAPRPAADGHGPGLFLAAGVARLHGGHLDVRAAPGAGATFTLSLPRA